jgi:nitroreductase
MELHEAMRTQRAIRRVRPDPVDDDVLLRCAELATRAPTGGNRQAVEFIFVRDPMKNFLLAARAEGLGAALTTRRPVEDSVHVDRYGHRPFRR